MFLRRIYHRGLSAVLRMVGLDFGWYVTFYRKWPYALPAVEPCLQRFRPRGRSLRFFAGYPFDRYAKAGDTVLDIGANTGVVSSHLLSLGFVVHAYEPDPKCVEFLRRRFSRIGASRFQLHPVAVSNFSGTANLYAGTRTTESNSILEDKPGTEATASGEVAVRSITDVLDAAGYAALILMDVEGAEYVVLEEMLRPENRSRFGLCVAESHARKIPALAADHRRVVDAIAQLGMQDRIMLDWH
jgi:FkbM family methyltransferase